MIIKVIIRKKNQLNGVQMTDMSMRKQRQKVHVKLMLEKVLKIK